MLHSKEKTAVFIDGANAYETGKHLGFDIDYARFAEYVRSTCNVLRFQYYTAVREEEEFSSIRPLIDWLDYNGYNVVTKPAKKFTSPSGVIKIKGNMDIDMCVDILELSQHVEHIILFSGDGDFVSLVDAVQRKGVRVTVFSAPDMLADELRRQADFELNINTIRDRIERGRTDVIRRVAR